MPQYIKSLESSPKCYEHDYQIISFSTITFASKIFVVAAKSPLY